MAFFLLMWLLNATTEKQRRGLADYFAPTNVISKGNSGAGKPFRGTTPFEKGDMVSNRGIQSIRPGKSTADADESAQNDQAPDPSDPRSSTASTDTDLDTTEKAVAGGNAETEQPRTGDKAPGGGQAVAQAQTPADGKSLANTAMKPDSTALKAELARRERAEFEQAAEQIRAAVRADPSLADIYKQLAIDQTPEGLRIQLMDEDRQPMFATGSATINDRARMLLAKVAPVLAKMRESIAIAGHTDATPYRGEGRSNWELSTERANATRRLLMEAGLQESRFRSVTGNADRDPLLPGDPLAAANRRIAIVVLRNKQATP